MTKTELFWNIFRKIIKGKKEKDVNLSTAQTVRSVIHPLFKYTVAVSDPTLYYYHSDWFVKNTNHRVICEFYNCKYLHPDWYLDSLSEEICFLAFENESDFITFSIKFKNYVINR